MSRYPDFASEFTVAVRNYPGRGLRGKRVFDISTAVVAAFLLAPVMLVIMLAIKLSDKGPILFKQQRVGFGGRKFYCYKFRSMVVNAEEALDRHLATDSAAKREWELAQKLAVDPRTTKLGRFLRRTSLDELPQLFNIIRGDMSLVGPRPILADEVSRYGEWIGHYMSVRPGLTGLWQVSGRSDCTYPQRVALDARYVEELSAWNDAIIIARTVPAILWQRGSR